MRLSSCPFQVTRTACALIVIPRSRSSSIESSTCSRMSRAETASVISRMRSASVDLPWSMCAMIEKLRILLWSMAGAMVLAAARGLFAREVDESARASALLDHDRAEPRMPEGHHELVAEPHAHRELVILARDDGALHALLGPDLEADALVERVDLER